MPQPTPHDELIAQLRNHVRAIQGISDRAYAGAHSVVSLQRRRQLERVGMRASDLIAALSQLVEF